MCVGGVILSFYKSYIIIIILRTKNISTINSFLFWRKTNLIIALINFVNYYYSLHPILSELICKCVLFI